MKRVRDEKIKANTQIIADHVKQQLPSLAESFSGAFFAALENYKALEKQGIKGKLSYCYCSFLRSSVIERHPLYRVDLYDEKQLLDLTECFAEWNVDFLTVQLYKDIPMEIKRMPYATDLPDYQIEQLWMHEAEKYFAAIAKEIAGIMQPAREKCASGITFYYGEFLGKSTKV